MCVDNGWTAFGPSYGNLNCIASAKSAPLEKHRLNDEALLWQLFERFGGMFFIGARKDKARESPGSGSPFHKKEWTK